MVLVDRRRLGLVSHARPTGAALPRVLVMSSNVVFAEPETALSDVTGLMLEHRIGAVPAVTPGSREVVDIVSYVDVLEASKTSSRMSKPSRKEKPPCHTSRFCSGRRRASGSFAV